MLSRIYVVLILRLLLLLYKFCNIVIHIPVFELIVYKESDSYVQLIKTRLSLQMDVLGAHR
jgi:hypothetical protein